MRFLITPVLYFALFCGQGWSQDASLAPLQGRWIGITSDRDFVIFNGASVGTPDIGFCPVSESYSLGNGAYSLYVDCETKAIYNAFLSSDGQTLKMKFCAECEISRYRKSGG